MITLSSLVYKICPMFRKMCSKAEMQYIGKVCQINPQMQSNKVLLSCLDRCLCATSKSLKVPSDREVDKLATVNR